ncbi:MAG: right-handed parallel beta-helix repeat-containing protein, partial [Promethearchaeota archaeon]
MKILHCTVSGGSSSSYYGLLLWASNNIVISDNELTGNMYGIHLRESSNNTITGNNATYNSGAGIYLSGSFMDDSIGRNNAISANNVSNNGIGIYLIWSSNTTLSENTANNNEFYGIVLIFAHGSILSGNNANYNRYYGISIAYSNYMVLSENLMIRGGMVLWSCYENDIDTTNEVNGKSVRYYENTPDLHLSGESDIGQVFLVNCSDAIIEGLDISNVTVAVMVTESFNCLISDNNISDCELGIYLYSSNFTTCSENRMDRGGLMLVDSYGSDIDATNKVNGKSLRYYENTPDLHLSGESDVGQVILVNCSAAIIEGLSIADTSYGISLLDSLRCTLSDNTIIGSVTGISLSDSDYNLVSGNNVSNNEDGLSLSASTYNSFSGNIVCNNDGGIQLAPNSNFNIFYFNDIYGNHNYQVSVGPACSDNQWDDGTTGNYWGDDYLTKYPAATNDGTQWDTPYEIDGGWGGIDHFPLVNSILYPQFIVRPEDFGTIEGYSGLNISWIMADQNPATYTIELDGIEVKSTTTWTAGVKVTYDIPEGLLDGAYNITIIVSDESGNTVQDTVIFTVGDEVKPQFTDIPQDFSAFEGYSGMGISWTVSDQYSATYTIELDGTEVVSATAWTSETAISYDIPNGLVEGNYNITIMVSDESGNMAQDTVLFTVSSIGDPIFINSNTDLYNLKLQG